LTGLYREVSEYRASATMTLDLFGGLVDAVERLRLRDPVVDGTGLEPLEPAALRDAPRHRRPVGVGAAVRAAVAHLRTHVLVDGRLARRYGVAVGIGREDL